MWTRTALASEFRRYRGRVWRVVEAQHRISTNRLSGDRADQRRLEELAEAVKPGLPKAARGLHYLLASPFRYGHGVASRFRRAGERPGIFYASESERTAIAEIAFWRLRFFARTPGFAPPAATSEHSSFSVPLDIARAIDLTRAPFAAEAEKWNDPGDYAACQKFATQARAARAQLIRSASVRDPQKGFNVALLDPSGFAASQPTMGQSWHLRWERGCLVALAAFPAREMLSFTGEQFGLDA